MKYLSVIEVAKKWNLNERRVRVLIQEKRIEGVKLEGHKYLISETAVKPLDRRYKGQRCFEDSPLDKINFDFKNYRKLFPNSEGYFGRFGGRFLPPNLSNQPMTETNYVYSGGIYG